jgi:16S rRNA (cytosine967-C5)-methyltransferase
VTAVDRSEARLERVSQNLRRLGLEAELVQADAADWSPGRGFDAVLLDAPCSATGTIRRHPDLKWLKRPEDVATLTRLQDRLIQAAIRLLKPGGTLVYAVCSLEAAECAERIAPLLAPGSGLESHQIRPGEIDGAEGFVTDTGWLRTLPCHWHEAGGIDGFFAARLKRA